MKKFTMITLLMLGLLIFGTPRVFSQAYTFTAGNLTYNENFDAMKMTGYLGGASFDNEDWLISSPINLSNFINTSLSFQTAMNYGADTTT